MTEGVISQSVIAMVTIKQKAWVRFFLSGRLIDLIFSILINLSYCCSSLVEWNRKGAKSYEPDTVDT